MTSSTNIRPGNRWYSFKNSRSKLQKTVKQQIYQTRMAISLLLPEEYLEKPPKLRKSLHETSVEFINISYLKYSLDRVK